MKVVTRTGEEGILLEKIDDTYFVRINGEEHMRMLELGDFQQRGFEVVPTEFMKHGKVETILPVRGDSRSAGYDFYSKETVIIQPHDSHLFWTDVCAYMQDDEVLMIYVRSSIGVKKGLTLKNTVGVIDASYYANPTNHGNVGVCLYNNSDVPVLIETGERIAQGVFQHYLVADNDTFLSDSRTGGFGSSGQK